MMNRIIGIKILNEKFKGSHALFARSISMNPIHVPFEFNDCQQITGEQSLRLCAD